jgi:hypothetical protein
MSGSKIVIIYRRFLFLPVNGDLDSEYPIVHWLMEMPVLSSLSVRPTQRRTVRQRELSVLMVAGKKSTVAGLKAIRLQ